MMTRPMNAVPAIIAVCALTISCATTSSQERDRLISQNKLSEKKVLLLERENSILKKETAQTEESLHTAEAHLEKVESDNRILKKKYNEDTALLNTQIGNMRKQNEIMKKESDEKIRGLTELNMSQEKKFTGEIIRLNAEMKTLGENFSRERETLKKDFAHKESEYQMKLNAAEEAARNKDAQITSLSDTVASLTAQLSDHTPQSTQTKAPSPSSGEPRPLGKPADEGTQSKQK